MTEQEFTEEEYNNMYPDKKDIFSSTDELIKEFHEKELLPIDDTVGNIRYMLVTGMLEGRLAVLEWILKVLRQEYGNISSAGDLHRQIEEQIKKIKEALK